jgi:hypothetical protein
MNPSSLWVTVGVSTGVAAGILGTYISWRQSRGDFAKAVTPTTAALTLVLVVASCLTVLGVKAAWEHRAWLFLVPASLTYWFANQVRTIRARRRNRRWDHGEEV